MSFVTRLLDWTIVTFSPLGASGLFLLAFIESIFFPIPPDILLIPLVLAHPQLVWWYAFVCTIGSVAGAFGGYWVGHMGKQFVLTRFIAAERIDAAHHLFQKYDAWAIFIAGFTPVPYKVFTVAAGIFHMRLWPFFVASLLSRGMRFFLVAALLVFYGDAIRSFLDSTFNVVSILLVLFIIFAYLLYKKFR